MYISVYVDPDEVLEQISECAIRDYCFNNDIVSINDFQLDHDNIEKLIKLWNKFPYNILDDSAILSMIQTYMNKGTVNMRRSKDEILKFVSELYDNAAK